MAASTVMKPAKAVGSAVGGAATSVLKAGAKGAGRSMISSYREGRANRQASSSQARGQRQFNQSDEGKQALAAQNVASSATGGQTQSMSDSGRLYNDKPLPEVMACLLYQAILSQGHQHMLVLLSDHKPP